MSGYLEHALYEYEMAVQAHAAEPGPNSAKHMTITFGIAAITLDAARTESIGLPVEINSELEQAISLTYAIRCAPAHDISEPVWILKPKYRRPFNVAGLEVDLTNRNELPFAIEHIGGHASLRLLADYLRLAGVFVPAG